MYTRCFERTVYNPYTVKEQYEVINISEYGFEWYINNKLVRSGLVEYIDEDIESILEAGFEEVV